jgi:hypothetical protein
LVKSVAVLTLINSVGGFSFLLRHFLLSSLDMRLAP